MFNYILLASECSLVYYTEINKSDIFTRHFHQNSSLGQYSQRFWKPFLDIAVSAFVTFAVTSLALTNRPFRTLVSRRNRKKLDVTSPRNMADASKQSH
jgi:hypothetical protein